MTNFKASVVAGFVLLLAASGTTQVMAEEVESTLMRGAKLYDKWMAVKEVSAPKESHSLYPKDKKYADKPGSNWRCKECHGWDYKGKDGAYASGSHFTGIKGIDGMAGADPAKVAAILKSAEHGYGDKLDENELQDLAMFVSKGQVDMDMYIDRASKAPKGDAAKGEAYYNTICANCHGVKGTKPKDMKPFGAQMGNPWEVMHKILNGQPGEPMPALRALDRQIVLDIMAHLATLPKER